MSEPHLRIVNVVGCRPNFVKLAPLIVEMKKHREIRPLVVHTGQHYDGAMSDVFFRDLDLPEPDVYLNVGSGSQITQLSSIAQSFEEALRDLRPDLVVVVGDVTSTLACSLASIKLGFPVAHVEAGLRSFDREMPEEVNRVLTDAISDFLFATEKSAVENLKREGIPRERIFLAGNVMIDTLRMSAGNVGRSAIVGRLGLAPKSYAVLTLHRPSNVDDRAALTHLAGALEELQRHIRVVFPIHPRTWSRMEQFDIWQHVSSMPNMQIVDPLGYVDFIRLVRDSLFVLTDSGGVQEESTALGIPCLTLRENTERPVTVTEGTNRLVGKNRERILSEGLRIIGGERPPGRIPEYWDGFAAQRIVQALLANKKEIKNFYRSVRERELCQKAASRA